ncbi:MAG: hypothetical protein PVF17_05955 [Ignavibacteria bacterium]|jgi:hypothetical protein
MKILYNKTNNEYYLMTNDNNEFYVLDDAYIVSNSLENLLKEIENINLENGEFYYSNIMPEEIVIFETDSKEELLNLPNTHPELFI